MPSRTSLCPNCQPDLPVPLALRHIRPRCRVCCSRLATASKKRCWQWNADVMMLPIRSFLQVPHISSVWWHSCLAHRLWLISQTAYDRPHSAAFAWYESPLTINFQAIRAILFAKATAISFGCFRFSSSSSQAEPCLPRPFRTCCSSDVAPTTNVVLKTWSPASVMIA